MTNVSASPTTVGLNLIAGSQLGGPSAQVTYVAIGAGAGLLSSGLTAGTPITSLPVISLPAALAAGQVLVIIYQTDIDYVTVNGAGAGAGAVSVPIASWTPTFAFPAGSGLVNMPSLGDTQLQAETDRFPLSGGTPGVAAGETLLSGYGDPAATPSGTYVEAGWFGGPTAGAGANTGTLMYRAAVWWAHTQNLDSATFQADSII